MSGKDNKEERDFDMLIKGAEKYQQGYPQGISFE